MQLPDTAAAGELSPYSRSSAIVRYVEGTIVEDLAQRGVISLNEKGASHQKGKTGGPLARRDRCGKK